MCIQYNIFCLFYFFLISLLVREKTYENCITKWELKKFSQHFFFTDFSYSLFIETPIRRSWIQRKTIYAAKIERKRSQSHKPDDLDDKKVLFDLLVFNVEEASHSTVHYAQYKQSRGNSQKSTKEEENSDHTREFP